MKSYEILNGITSPQDLKNLDDKQLTRLCEEIREKLIETVSVNGGHLSPNLGVVELTVMLHYVFDSPKDSIIWDVGHQSYTHKILTGRLGQIDTIRTENGLSGFPKRSESKHDAFNVGHSSTSISAAYGIAQAKSLLGDNSYTIAVIGDGSLTGGLAYEGLNNAGRFNRNFIVILNDNKMSISHNVGAIARYLSNMRIQPWYLRVKKYIEGGLSHFPVVGGYLKKHLQKSKSKLKRLIYKDTFFDSMGFTYYGPVDGHDMDELKKALQAAKRMTSPVLLHVVTKKGKGYQYAENDPKNFHGIGSFDVETGEPLSSGVGFSDVFGDYLTDAAKEDRTICAITAAMKSGTGLNNFAQTYKNRFFDVGIAEEHAVTFACGLASKGMMPVFSVYSTFLQRSYDQILHDAAAQQLHIVLAIDRAGVVGEDGETHQGVFDVSLLNSVPGATIYSPCYFEGLSLSLNRAMYYDMGVAAVRYPRGGELYRPKDLVDVNEDYNIYGDENSEVLLITYGREFSNVCLAKEALKKNHNKDVCILKLCRIKPINPEAIEFAMKFEKIAFFEEGILSGGIAETFLSNLESRDYKGEYIIRAIEDEFVPHGKVNSLLCRLGLDSQSVEKLVMDRFFNN